MVSKHPLRSVSLLLFYWLLLIYLSIFLQTFFPPQPAPASNYCKRLRSLWWTIYRNIRLVDSASLSSGPKRRPSSSLWTLSCWAPISSIDLYNTIKHDMWKETDYFFLTLYTTFQICLICERNSSTLFVLFFINFIRVLTWFNNSNSIASL